MQILSLQANQRPKRTSLSRVLRLSLRDLYVLRAQLKAELHRAIFSATCLAKPLRHKFLIEELHGVTCYLFNLSRNCIFVAHSLARSRTQFYFLQRSQQLSIAVAQCNTPPVTCLRAMLCSISQSGSLLSSPRSSSVAGFRVAGSPNALCNTSVRATAMLCFSTFARQVA